MTTVFYAHVATIVVVFLLNLWLRGNILEAIEAATNTIIEWVILNAILAAVQLVAVWYHCY